jgi:threonine aldolase
LDDGTFDLEKLEAMLPDYTDRCCGKVRVVCIENSQNWCGGRILPMDFIEKLADLCKKHNLKLHLDGSRIMNVSEATKIDVKTLCKDCDSVNFCFSKVNSSAV